LKVKARECRQGEKSLAGFKVARHGAAGSGLGIAAELRFGGSSRNASLQATFARRGRKTVPSSSLRATNAVSGHLGRSWLLLFGSVGGNTLRAGSLEAVSAEEHERLRKAAAAVWVPTRASECLLRKRWRAQGNVAGEVEGKALQGS